MSVIKKYYAEILVQGIVTDEISLFMMWHDFYIQGTFIIWLLTGFLVIPAIVRSSSDEEVSFLSLS